LKNFESKLFFTLNKLLSIKLFQIEILITVFEKLLPHPYSNIEFN
jgi:hypothetical protein